MAWIGRARATTCWLSCSPRSALGGTTRRIPLPPIAALPGALANSQICAEVFTRRAALSSRLRGYDGRTKPRHTAEPVNRRARSGRGAEGMRGRGGGSRLPRRGTACFAPLVMLTIPPAAADRFALLIEGLCQAVAASCGRGLAGPLILLIWTRLRRLGARFAALAARQRTDKPPPARRPRPAAPRPRAPRLPRGFAWLVRLVPEAAVRGSQLRHLLTEPEMAALIAAAPQAGRLLRPLCRMLGVDPPPALRLPRRPGAAPAAPAPASPAQVPSAQPPPRLRPPPRRRLPSGLAGSPPPLLLAIRA
jgi:hypothetical protein